MYNGGSETFLHVIFCNVAATMVLDDRTLSHTRNKRNEWLGREVPVVKCNTQRREQRKAR